MEEITFQKRVLNKLENMNKRIKYVMRYIEDSKLSEDDKKAIDETLNEEKEGKLLSKDKVFN
ncbi:hypothetical protein CL617_05240 [archaeon]|nr:hypothetical protein [archaeon]|tara:strand:+ start:2380 stop:2565 length:186 start_codon:yes stop_codon:yes gene_type:complete